MGGKGFVGDESGGQRVESILIEGGVKEMVKE